MTGLLKDLRCGLRFLLKAPGFTAVAVMVLALGIGANTAIFTLVNAMVVRPLPGRADELFGLFSHDRTKPDSYRAFSYPNYADIRDRSDVFDGLTAHIVSLVGMPAGETTRRVFVDLVSSNYFDALGVKLAAGRTFSAEEERPGAGIRVVIVGYDRWKNAGFDPALLGRALTINAQDFTIVGIAPPGFTGTIALIAPEVWLPLGVFDTVVNDIFKNKGTGLADRGNDSLIVAGRLKPGISETAAAARLDALSRRLEGAFPAENRNQVLSINRLSRLSISTEPQTNDGTGLVTTFLMAMSSVVLLIACLNLANMLLARGSARRREIAIRLALGGARGRIVRQLLTESLLLAVAGAAIGLVIAYWAVRLLTTSLASVLPLTLQLNPRPDLYVLAATCGFAVASTLLFGLVPALKLSRADLVTDLKADAGSRGGMGLARRFGPRNVLVIGQIALSLALLIVGGLFGRGAMKAATADPGFRYDRELLVALDPSLAAYDERRGRTTYRMVLSRLRELPGIEAAGMASAVPFGEFHEGRRVERIGRSSAQPEAASGTYLIIGNEYFSALGLRMLRGREFTSGEEESASAPRVAIIDEPLARQLFPNEDPIGQQIRFQRAGDARGRPDDEPQPMEIVGIAPGLRFQLFDRGPVPHVYVPFGRNYRAAMHVHVRVAGGMRDEAGVLALIRRELRAVDNRLPVLQLTTMHAFHDRGIMLWVVRAGGNMFLLFGAVALALAVAGVYGVKSYVVSTRTREIGIRIALGARPADVLWMVLRDGLWLTAIGLAIGLPLAALAGLGLSKMLYEVSAVDPIVFVVAPTALGLAATLASYIPARRATTVTPLTALRVE